MSYLKRLTEILAWGGSSWHYYEHRGRKKKGKSETYPENIETVLKEYKERGGLYPEREEEEETEGQELPPKLNEVEEEATKRIVQRGRSKYDRIEKLKKLAYDQDFLKSVVNAETQYEDVRIAALYRITDEAFLKQTAEKVFATEPNGSMARAAIANIKDQTFLTQLLLKYPTDDLLRKVTDEKAISKVLAKSQELRRRSDRLDFIKDEKLLEPVVDALTPDDDADFIRHLAIKIQEKDLLRKLLDKSLKTRERYWHYGGGDINSDATAITLYRLKDKSLAKKVVDQAFEPENRISDGALYIALEVLDDQEAYKKVASRCGRRSVSQADHLALSKIEDQDFLKALTRPKPPKVSEPGEEPDEPEPGCYTAYQYIKDKKWVREQYDAAANDEKAHILESIDDQKLFKEIVETGTSDSLFRTAARKLKDKEYLKNLYLDLLKNRFAGQEKGLVTVDRWGQRVSNKREDETQKRRQALVDALDDPQFLHLAFKKDPIADIRSKAYEKLDDPEILFEMLVREKGKNNRHDLIVKLSDHQEHLLNYVSDAEYHVDDDTTNFALSKLNKESAKKLLTGNFHNASSSLNIDRILSHFDNDQAFLKKLFLQKEKPRWIDDESLLSRITDENFLMKYVGAEKIDYQHIDKIKNQKYLMEIALKRKSVAGGGINEYIASKAFERIVNAPATFYEKALMTAASQAVREKALPFVTNEKLLKKLLFSNDLLAPQVLPRFKDDVKTLEEALLKAENYEVKKKLSGRIKNPEVLKKFILQERDENLIAPAFEKVKDPEFQKEVALNAENSRIAKSACSGLHKDGQVDDLREVFLKRDWSKDWSNFTPVHFQAYFGDVLEEQDHIEFIGRYLESPSRLNKHAYRVIESYIREVINEGKLSQGSIRKLLQTLPEERDQLKFVVLPLLKGLPKQELPDYFDRISDEESRARVLLLFRPEDLKPEHVDLLLNAYNTSEDRDAISTELLGQAYIIGTPEQQSILKEIVPEGVLTPEHKEEMFQKHGAERYQYRLPQFTHRHNTPLDVGHKPQKNPKHELLRLLVRLARTP